MRRQRCVTKKKQCCGKHNPAAVQQLSPPQHRTRLHCQLPRYRRSTPPPLVREAATEPRVAAYFSSSPTWGSTRFQIVNGSSGFGFEPEAFRFPEGATQDQESLWTLRRSAGPSSSRLRRRCLFSARVPVKLSPTWSAAEQPYISVAPSSAPHLTRRSATRTCTCRQAIIKERHSLLSSVSTSAPRRNRDNTASQFPHSAATGTG